MITYVIPTLWRDENIYRTIEEFSKIEDPDSKLIIINNTDQVMGIITDRVEFVNMGYNSFVNPAWNLGVDMATTDYVCLLNDDIYMDLKSVHQYIKNERPEFVGFSELNRNPKSNSLQLVKHSDMNKRPFGFGQFMLFKKKNWTKIPEEMKIFHGDDVIYFYHTLILGIELYKLDGLKIYGNQSISASDWWESDIAKQDIIEYFKWIESQNLECTIHDSLKSAWHRKDFAYKQYIEKQILN